MYNTSVFVIVTKLFAPSILAFVEVVRKNKLGPAMVGYVKTTRYLPPITEHLHSLRSVPAETNPRNLVGPRGKVSRGAKFVMATRLASLSSPGRLPPPIPPESYERVFSRFSKKPETCGKKTTLLRARIPYE